jgi:hypothetical protein
LSTSSWGALVVDRRRHDDLPARLPRHLVPLQVLAPPPGIAGEMDQAVVLHRHPRRLVGEVWLGKPPTSVISYDDTVLESVEAGGVEAEPSPALGRGCRAAVEQR